MNKTVVQKLIDNLKQQVDGINKIIPFSTTEQVTYLFNKRDLINNILKEIGPLLEDEKGQIIDSYANGHNDGCRYMTNVKQEFEHAEQYYNQRYNQNK